VGFPNWTAVKILERLCPRRHIGKTPEPNESVSIIEIAELADDLHPDSLLRLDEFPVEEIDQYVPFSGVQSVLSELNDGRACFCWGI
jgi:hypothetical protein